MFSRYEENRWRYRAVRCSVSDEMKAIDSIEWMKMIWNLEKNAVIVWKNQKISIPSLFLLKIIRPFL